MYRQDDLYTKQLIFGGLFVISNNLQTLMDRELSAIGITSKQWLLLAVLEEFYKEGSPTLKEAAMLMGTSHQNVKQIALKLVEKGFVSLEKDEKDKRIIRVKRLVSGTDFGETYTQDALHFLSTLFKDFNSEDLKALLGATYKLTDRLKEMGKEIE